MEDVATDPGPAFMIWSYPPALSVWITEAGGPGRNLGYLPVACKTSHYVELGG